jgi:hypothetical protein
VKFVVYPEGRGAEAKTIEAVNRMGAALAFVNDIEAEDARALRLIVSDEQARIWIVNARPRISVDWDATTQCECGPKDLWPDDPMPTPEATALHAARYAATRTA